MIWGFKIKHAIALLAICAAFFICGALLFKEKSGAPQESSKERALRKVQENSFSGTAFDLSDEEKNSINDYGL